MENLVALVNRLRELPNETEWLEFKHDKYTPDMIGEDISALANSAALLDRPTAYLIWGIDDSSHDVVGTTFHQYAKLVNNQEISSWLRELLSKNADFDFETVEIEHKTIVVLIIYRAANQPVAFKKADYIRVGSYTKKLNAYPELQAKLWDKLRAFQFESHLAKQDIHAEELLTYLDWSAYFEIVQERQPSSLDGMLHYMTEEGAVIVQDNGLYAITNLGAILFARRLSDFPRISRKAIRVVQYDGSNRLNIKKEHTHTTGYVVGFESFMQYIEALVPSQDEIRGAIRYHESAYPMPAIREIVANALIHQDFSVTGTGPVVELFDNRIEVTNPGIPLVDVFRIIDNPPKSRNEKLASLMRRLKMCEELGSGWDRITILCEIAQLPAPRIDLYENASTKVTLFAEMPYANIPQQEKLWACYLHACIKYVEGDALTNGSLRKRFGLKDSAAANISRLIKEAIAQQYIKPLDAQTAPRYMKYVPIWA